MFNTGGEILLTLNRVEAEDSFELADLRIAGIGATAPGGFLSPDGSARWLAARGRLSY